MSTNRYDGKDLDVIEAALGTVAAPPVSALHVYVAVDGNDANPGTIAQPKATLAGAYALLPRLLSAPFVVHFASGNYAYLAPPTSVSLSREAFVVLVGDGAGQPGDDGSSLRATGTIDAGSTLDLLKTTSVFIATAHVGATLEMTSGQAAGSRRTIADNTTSEIIPAYELTHSGTGAALTASAGDTFRIVQPGVRFQVSGDVDVNGHMQVDLINVAFFGTARLLINSTPGAPQQWYGVELDLSVTIFALAQNGLYVGTAPSAQEFTRLTAASGGPTVPNLWRGWGIGDPPTGTSRWIVCVGSCYLGIFICSLNGYMGALATSQFCEVVVWGGRLASLWMANGGNWRVNSLTVPFIISSVNTTTLLTAGLGARVVLYGKLRLTQAHNGHTITSNDTGSLQFHTTEFKVTSAASATFPIFNALGVSQMVLLGTVDVTATGAAPALSIGEKARFTAATVNAIQGGSSLVYGAAEAYIRSLTLSGGTGPALQLLGSARVQIGGPSAVAVLSLSCSAPGAGALYVAPGAALVHYAGPGSMTIANTATAANSDGIRCSGEVTVGLAGSVSVTSQGSTGFGVNCRGGGRFRCSIQPTGIVGPTADFSIGTGVGEDFADTELSGAYAAKVAGGSLVQRAT